MPQVEVSFSQCMARKGVTIHTYPGNMCCCWYCSSACSYTQIEELLQFVRHSTNTQAQQRDDLAWVGIAGAATVRFDEAWLVLL